MAQRDTKVSELCLELGVTKATIYRYVAPDGSWPVSINGTKSRVKPRVADEAPLALGSRRE